MSWLSNVVNSAAGWGGEDPNAIAQRQIAAQQAAAAEVERQRLANLAASTGEAGQAGVVASGVNKGLTALPEGFEMGLLPADFGNPFVESSVASSRAAADDYINNMLKRGTTTATGADAARTALTAQDPTVRAQISDISNSLLEQERAKLRGYGAGGDIAPAQAEATAFQGGFGDALSSAVPAGLYSTAGLGGAAGAATDPRNITLDPYASEGGLKTGLTDPASAAGAAKKKRTTAVF